MFKYLSGLGFLVVYTVLSAALHLMQWPAVLLLPFKTPFRAYNRWIEETWADIIVLTTSWFSPTKLVVSGDSLEGQSNLILISNHQTFADWWYLWCLAYNRNREGSLKIILKHSLKNIPLWGWAMQFFEFIFLRRNWENDSRMMRKVLESYTERSSHPYCLVIFPEGTIIREESLQKSRKYAEQHKFTPLKHQLLPRTTGLKLCLDVLRNTTDQFVDVTIGYKGVQAGQITSHVFTLSSIFLKASPPPELHMHIRVFPLSDVPTDQAEFVQWTMKLFQEKDALLDSFYQKGFFHEKRKVENIKIKSYSRFAIVFVYTIFCLSLTIACSPIFLGVLASNSI